MFVFRWLLVCMLVCTSAHADIIKTADLEAIKGAILNSDKNTLVIFDVDLVLITPKDQVLKVATKEASDFREQANKELRLRISEKQLQYLYSIIQLDAEIEPVAQNTLSIFNEIKSHGFKTIALTASGTGSFGKISSLEQWRVKQLYDLGFTFSKSLPNTYVQQLDKYLTNISSQSSIITCSPVFHSGILYTCYFAKGDTLDAYLQVAKIKPSKIVFIDDRRENLETVADYCEKNNISFLGFEYTAIKDSNNLPFNRRRTQLQFDILEHGEVWLSDVMADKIIANLDGLNKI
jgi:hypothetical protein